MELSPSEVWERGFYQGYKERAQDGNLIMALMHAERCAHDAPEQWSAAFFTIAQGLRRFIGEAGTTLKMQRAVARAREIQSSPKLHWAEAWLRAFEDAAEAHYRAQSENRDAAERGEAEAAYSFARQFLIDALSANAPTVNLNTEWLCDAAERLKGAGHFTDAAALLTLASGIERGLVVAASAVSRETVGVIATSVDVETKGVFHQSQSSEAAKYLYVTRDKFLQYLSEAACELQVSSNPDTKNEDTGTSTED
jgi:hypothetical protein